MSDVDLAAVASTATVPDELAVGVLGEGRAAVLVLHLPGHNVRTRRPETVTLALGLPDAADLCRQIIAAVRDAAPERDTFGRPQ